MMTEYRVTCRGLACYVKAGAPEVALKRGVKFLDDCRVAKGAPRLRTLMKNGRAVEVTIEEVPTNEVPA